MNAKQRALHYLSRESCYRRPDYLKVDDNIAPIVEWMNHHGYITLHSCAGHEDCEGVRRNYWYVWFVATAPLQTLRQAIQRMPFPMTLEQEKHLFLTRSWTWSMWIEPRTDEEIQKRNKEVFRCLNQRSSSSQS